MSLEFEIARIEPDIAVIRLTGSLIAGPEGQTLERFVRDLVGGGERKVIFDLCGIEKIDSAGGQYLIQCCFTMRQAGGELRLASANRRVERLFTVTRLDTQLPFYRTVASASANFELKKGASAVRDEPT